MLVITTERLRLRDFREDDLSAYVELRAQPAFQRFQQDNDDSTKKAERLLDMFITWANEQPRRRFQLAITLDSGELIGTSGVRVVAEREASFGCELGPAYWGRGYAYEAGRAMLEWGFRELGLHRIYAETFVENEAAVRLAQRLGMRSESVLRESRHFKNRTWSTLMFSLLESEWSASPASPGA